MGSILRSDGVMADTVKIKMLDADRVAEIYLVTVWTVREWCKQNKFPGAVKSGRKWLIPESDVLKDLEKKHG
jgi:predicted site-specific integrase-resolvase